MTRRPVSSLILVLPRRHISLSSAQGWLRTRRYPSHADGRIWVNQMADRHTKPPTLTWRHLLIPMAVMLVGLLSVSGTVFALDWFSQKSFAEYGESLGLSIIGVVMFIFLIRHRLEGWRQLLSWCIAAVPIAAIATVIQALVLITLPNWSGGDDGSPRFLAQISGGSAIIVVLPLLILASLIIGPPERKRRGTQDDGDTGEA